MKTTTIWILLLAAMVPLTACHLHHRHYHRFAAGYSNLNAASLTEQPGAAVHGG